jgi:hypothetical protein
MKRKFNWNVRTTVGMIIGILTPVIAIPLVMEIIALKDNFAFSRLWHEFLRNHAVQSKFISLACIPNLGWFYLFLNKERYDLARGVIIGCACFIPYIIYLVFG